MSPANVRVATRADRAAWLRLRVALYAECCATRDVGYLEGWYVEPEHRGTGVGRALVRAAERWAREQGCAELASDADPRDDRSRRAHTACGFDDVGLVRCFRKPL